MIRLNHVERIRGAVMNVDLRATLSVCLALTAFNAEAASLLEGNRWSDYKTAVCKNLSGCVVRFTFSLSYAWKVNFVSCRIPTDYSSDIEEVFFGRFKTSYIPHGFLAEHIDEFYGIRSDDYLTIIPKGYSAAVWVNTGGPTDILMRCSMEATRI